MGFFGGGSTTTTTKLDPQTQAYVDYMRRVAMGYGGAPTTGTTGNAPGAGWAGLAGSLMPHGTMNNPVAPYYPPEIQQAQQQYGNYAQAGQQGLAALTGTGPNAFMNPYLAAMNPYFLQQRQQAVNAANDQATLAGAFGGDRSQIGAAVAGSQADINQAGFNYQAYNDAMQRALQAANLGFGATGAAAFLPQQYAAGQLGLLQQGLGPYGQSQTTATSTPWGSQLLGLGLTAASFFPPTAPFARGAMAVQGGLQAINK